MNTPQPGHIGWSPDYQTAPPITSKSDEIAGIKRTLEKTREQLHKALDAVVALSTRNSELRAAIHATINESPELPFKRLRDATGEGK
jgi:hypothetical protein